MGSKARRLEIIVEIRGKAETGADHKVVGVMWEAAF